MVGMMAERVKVTTRLYETCLGRQSLLSKAYFTCYMPKANEETASL